MNNGEIIGEQCFPTVTSTLPPHDCAIVAPKFPLPVWQKNRQYSDNNRACNAQDSIGGNITQRKGRHFISKAKSRQGEGAESPSPGTT